MKAVAVKQEGPAHNYDSKELTGGKEVLTEDVNHNGDPHADVPGALKGNTEGGAEAISKELQGGREVVTEAVKLNIQALEYASRKLKGAVKAVCVKQEGYTSYIYVLELASKSQQGG